MMKYKINFLGESRVGKSTWIHKIMTETFEKDYVATIGTEMIPLTIKTNYGEIHLELHDYAGQKRFSGGDYVDQADATILMFDLTDEYTYQKLTCWYEKCGPEPIFIIGNKYDLSEREVFDHTFATELNLPYLELSALRMNKKPLLTPILRRVTGYSNLILY